MLRKLTIALLLVVMPISASAEVNPKTTNVRNAGAFLCSDFLPVVMQEGRQLEKTAFLNWAAAYSTAASRSIGVIDMFPIGDSWELVRAVSLVCLENEQQSFEAALQTFLKRMRPFWVVSSPSVTTITDPNGRKIALYTEAVRPLQEALNKYGAGLTVDGQFGDQTGMAILRINQARGAQGWLTPDGELLYQITRQN